MHVVGTEDYAKMFKNHERSASDGWEILKLFGSERVRWYVATNQRSETAGTVCGRASETPSKHSRCRASNRDEGVLRSGVEPQAKLVEKNFFFRKFLQKFMKISVFLGGPEMPCF